MHLNIVNWVKWVCCKDSGWIFQLLFHRICRLHIQQAELDAQVPMGQHEADKDRLLLIQEKEDLLKELKNRNTRKWSEDERLKHEEDIDHVRAQIREAQDDVQRVITDRWGVCRSCMCVDLAEWHGLVLYKTADQISYKIIHSYLSW